MGIGNDYMKTNVLALLYFFFMVGCLSYAAYHLVFMRDRFTAALGVAAAMVTGLMSVSFLEEDDT